MEWQDVYDVSREKTGKTRLRGESYQDGEYRLRVTVCLLNSEGKMLIQKRSKDRKLFPDIWALTGGAVQMGETGEEAVLREAKEELGISLSMEKGRKILLWTDHEDHRHQDIFLFLQDVPDEKISLQKEEVQEVKWVYPEEITENPEYRKDFEKDKGFSKVFPALLAQSFRNRIPKGVYRHYKGNLYEVLDIAVHSETLEAMVIYRALYGTCEIWARPAKMWNEEVFVNGKSVLRFEKYKGPKSV